MLLPLSKGEEGGTVEAKKLAGNPSLGLVNAGFETASPSAKTRIKAETSARTRAGERGTHAFSFFPLYFRDTSYRAEECDCNGTRKYPRRRYPRVKGKARTREEES